MNFLLYLASICLIALQAFSLFPSLLLFVQKKQKLHLWFALIFLINLLEYAILSYFNLAVNLSLEEFYLQIGFPRIVLTSLVLAFELCLILQVFNIKKKPSYFLALFPYLIFVTITLQYSSRSLYLWLFYTAHQIYRFLLIGFFMFLYYKKRNQSQFAHLKRYLPLFLTFTILNCTIIIEDALTISHISTFFYNDSFSLRGYNLSEYLLYFSFAIFYLVIALKLLLPVSNRISQTVQSVGGFDIVSFANTYQLTPRESEVVLQLLNNTSTVDIAQALFISQGTLKTHMHNIYTKTNTSNRIELEKLLATH